MNQSDMLKNNRILIVDDNPSIHEDIRKILSGRGEQDEALGLSKALLFGDDLPESDSTQFEIHSAHQGQEGLEMVQKAVEIGRPYAMAFVDVRMPPGWDGVETISRIWKLYPDLQIVICTAYSDYSWAEMIRQFGKTDSLVILKKPFDNIEVLQLAHALTEKWQLSYRVRNRLNDLDQAVNQRTTELQFANEQLKNEIAERMQVEKSLRLSEERFSKAFEASPIPLAIQSLRQETFLDANLGFQKLTGFSHAELIGQTPQALNINGDAAGDTTVFQKIDRQISVRDLPRRMRTKSGQMRNVLISVELFELDNEPLLLTIAQDITEQITLENQLRQAQKMEAVGQLAAGLAHDFNNILTVIQGYSTLLLGTKPPDSSDRKPLKTIIATSERARKLVRQLLTFSRKQLVQKTAMDIQSTISDILEMLPRVLPESIVVSFNVSPDLPKINADPGMMEQMLMNLAVNAADAMTEGGKFSISAESFQVSPAFAQDHKEARPGQFLCLTVSDTGCGMPPEVLSHIFEPFFTTKPVGKGTGLGLATVYGIVKQHEGWLEVQSEPGKGTTFRIFIPICNVKPKHENVPSTLESASRGTETILVVEDETELREFVVQVLRSHGYQAIAAESGPQALERWAENRGKIDLLLTDIVMPGGLTGRQVGERLLAEDPALKVLYSSGYSVGMTGKDGLVIQHKNFLPKPYCPTKLLETLRRCLDGPAQ